MNNCLHKWGKWIDIRDIDFGVKFGRYRKCLLCSAIEHESWTKNRSTPVTTVIKNYNKLLG